MVKGLTDHLGGRVNDGHGVAVGVAHLASAGRMVSRVGHGASEGVQLVVRVGVRSRFGLFAPIVVEGRLREDLSAEFDGLAQLPAVDFRR